MRIFDLFCFKYNRTDFHELDLDWIISDLRTLAETLENFISLNTIKYANPIQWNITTQYEANTVVIDANDGTAYISIQPVPSGVAITNTDYWTPIFTLNLLSANQNITLRDDGSNVLATFASDTDNWLIWNAILYKVSQPIAVNEAYVVGYNLTRYSVELFISDYISNLLNIIGNLTDLTTTDKSNIVAAINEIADNIGNLTDLDTTDKNNIVAAINEIVNNIGDLADLDTIADSNIVAAINETKNNYVTPQMFGAVGDGVTDDTTAIQDAFDYAVTNQVNVYFPPASYFVTSSIGINNDTDTQVNIKIYGNSVPQYFGTHAMPEIICDNTFSGDDDAVLHFTHCWGITIEGLTIRCTSDSNTFKGIYLSYCQRSLYSKLTIKNFKYGFYGSRAGLSRFKDFDITMCMFAMWMFSCGDSQYEGMYLNTNVKYDNANNIEGIGAYLTYCGGVSWIGGKIEFNRFGIYLDNSIGFNISDVCFDIQKRGAIYMNGVNTEICVSNCYFRGGGYEGYNSEIVMINAGKLILNNCLGEVADDSGNVGPLKWIRWVGTPTSDSKRYIMVNNCVLDPDDTTNYTIEGSGQNEYLYVYLSNVISNESYSLNNATVKTASYT